MGKRYLIGQLGKFGDCLYATTVAKQLKTDEPDCHITWAIGSLYRSILDGNPYVDAIWEIPIKSNLDSDSIWRSFSVEAHKRKKNGEFDRLYLTQISPDNFRYFDGTVRSSIFRAFGRPITVSVDPVIVLNSEEVSGVQDFANRHKLNQYREVILFENSYQSKQSFITPSFALDVAEALVSNSKQSICVIMSAIESVTTCHKNIIDGSKLTFRQNAELTKYCTLFVGCSSGISWLCTSEWAKPLPMLLLLDKQTGVYASMVHDHEYFKLPSLHIIEMTDCDSIQVVNCINEIIINGLHQARRIYHTQIKNTLYFYFVVIRYAKLSFRGILQSFFYTATRYGFCIFFVLFIYNMFYFLKKNLKTAIRTLFKKQKINLYL